MELDDEAREFRLTVDEARAVALWFEDANAARFQYAWERALAERLRIFVASPYEHAADAIQRHAT